jgi:hypothetical protein
MVLFATNGAAQTSPLDLLLQQQSQGLPFGTDMQSLEDMFSGQGFDINPECLSPLELCQYILAKGVRKHGSKALF